MGVGLLPTLLHTRRAFGQTVGVPADLQGGLFAKLARYDRNFARRAGTTAHVLLVVKPNDAASAVFTASLKAALGRVDRIGGLPHRETLVEYKDARALARLCRTEHAAAVYIPPGFNAELDALRSALTGVDILSVGAEPRYVPGGTVLGFHLESGKPKIVVELQQATRQNVNFQSDVLKLMKVYR